MKCPESIEELKELEKLIPLCKVTLFEQAKARIETGSAKSVSEASRQLAEETGRKAESIRRQIHNEQGVKGSHLSEIAGTDIYRPERPHVSYNSGENEWYTPPEYIEAARNVMGSIDLDPASSEIANKTVKAKWFYTKDNNGLEKEWAGNIWMNPPYASDLIKQFTSRFIEQFNSGDIQQAIILVNNATETIWFQDLLNVASAVCFVKGRIKYLNTVGEAANSPLQGQAFFYTGKNIAGFLEVFSSFGVVLVHG